LLLSPKFTLSIVLFALFLLLDICSGVLLLTLSLKYNLLCLHYIHLNA
jgi:hypothetical protein